VYNTHNVDGTFPPKHGESGTPPTSEYTSWRSMLRRVRGTLGHAYPVRPTLDDPRWEQYENFLTDMGRKPSPRHTIDRIENYKGYCKSNCRWATKGEQAYNRTTTKLDQECANVIRFIYAGGGCSQQDIANVYGVSRPTIAFIVEHKTWRE